MKTKAAMAIKAVIDTNVFVSSLSSRSEYHWLISNLLDDQFELYITTDIFLEYEEILTLKYSADVAGYFLSALKELQNVFFVQVYFQWNLLDDPDDNKFVDCYIAAGANYLITHDRDFNKLAFVGFPAVNIIGLPAFKNLLQLSGNEYT